MSGIVGIDIGTARIRAAASRRVGRETRVEMVSVRDVPSGAVVDGDVADAEIVAAVLEDLLVDLPTRPRDCVFAVGPPAATLRLVRLPAMGSAERHRAARIDVERRMGRAAGDIFIRAVPVPQGPQCAVGAVAGRTLRSRADAVRRAGLRPRAADFEGLALSRALPHADAILDVGLKRLTLYADRGGELSTLWSAVGGATVTAAIGDDLGVAESHAERRKRTVGTAGAGERAFGEIVTEASKLVATARRRGCSISKIGIVGNGSRLPGFRSAFERAADVDAPLFRPAGLGPAYPDDVATASSMDWALAVGLALWCAP